MAFIPTENTLGVQPFGANSTTQNHPLGTIMRGYDTTLGGAEFIYLLGVASTVVGSVVTYNATTFQTTLSPNTANNENPIAVAMAANLASQYGWYQISGLATVKKTNTQFLPGGKVYQSGTAGRVMATSASGKQVIGARAANLTTVTTTTSTIVVLLNRPNMQGQIT
jgi:hypothetical protein